MNQESKNYQPKKQLKQAEKRICQNCGKEFTIEPEDFEFYEKIGVPAPTFCPDCRLQRRMMFRNERKLYKRKCDATGKDIISIYSPDKPYKVYDQKYWWSDKWDPMDYGRDYDWNKPFFEQFKELRNNFPLMSLSNARATDSDYCNVNDKSKDCYLISASYENERVFYSNRITFNKDCMDLYIGNKNELCYENVSCNNSYKLFFSRNSTNCLDSYFLYNCHNCQNCFGCVNLKNKQYCIFNKQYSKEEYFKKLKEFNLGSYRSLIELKKKFYRLYLGIPHKYSNISKSVDCSGDNLSNSKNCHSCFDIEAAENCKFASWGGFGLKDSYDSGPGIGDNSELLYEVFDIVKDSSVYFSSVVYNSYNIQYSFNCYFSSHLFGCIGLRHKQYCILNKQYTKEEYEKLVPKIIKHMNEHPYIDKKGRVYRYGEFFPPELSPFAYNETIAQEYFPLTKEEAIEKGYQWSDQ
ncbi:MAG TPA: hypothetical protein ENL06_01585, partial [Candidatus Portnoybacteria bacterium]|nr:hypothetical protein [Candidatus Portnoybacteria bacterium]